MICKRSLAYLPPVDADRVFKGLADPSRRRLLDALRKRNGQALGRLCAHLDMTRQAVSQHLKRLEDANLVRSVRRGREKLHYLNPVPIHEIYDRWIRRFERRRLDVLRDIKRKAEGSWKATPLDAWPGLGDSRRTRGGR